MDHKSNLAFQTLALGLLLIFSPSMVNAQPYQYSSNDRALLIARCLADIKNTANNNTQVRVDLNNDRNLFIATGVCFCILDEVQATVTQASLDEMKTGDEAALQKLAGITEAALPQCLQKI